MTDQTLPARQCARDTLVQLAGRCARVAEQMADGRRTPLELAALAAELARIAHTTEQVRALLLNLAELDTWQRTHQ